jgi:hypothetical protein
MPDSLLQYHVRIEELRYRAMSDGTQSHTERDYLPITDAFTDDKTVLAGLLRSIADKFDPPQPNYR